MVEGEEEAVGEEKAEEEVIQKEEAGLDSHLVVEVVEEEEECYCLLPWGTNE